MTRLELYLEDERTVSVLLKHVQDRILDEYREFREVALEAHGFGSSIRSEIGDDETVKLMVLGLSDGGSVGGPSGAGDAH